MAKYQENRIFTLNEPNAPRLNPALAVEIGLNESILLLQIEFWIATSSHFIDGKKWTYQSTSDLEQFFPFWSRATINRAINSLIERELIIIGNYNKYKYDRTRWFSLNYQKLSELKSIKIGGHETRSAQNETGSNQNETGSTQNETTIPNISTENSTKTTPKKKIYPESVLKITDWAIEQIKSHHQITFDNNQKEKIKKMFNKFLIKEKIDEDKIKKAIHWVTKDTYCNDRGFCWSNQFLSPLKLERRDKDGIRYLEKFIALMQADNGSSGFHSKVEAQVDAEMREMGILDD